MVEAGSQVMWLPPEDMLRKFRGNVIKEIDDWGIGGLKKSIWKEKGDGALPGAALNRS